MSNYKKNHYEDREGRGGPKIPGSASRKRINDILRNARSIDFDDLEDLEDEIEFEAHSFRMRL